MKDKESGFTLPEIVITIGILSFVTIGLFKVVDGSRRTMNTIDQMASHDKVTYMETLPLRTETFSRFESLVKEAQRIGLNCLTKEYDGKNFSFPVSLFQWHSYDKKEDFCVDLKALEEKDNGNIIDVQFASHFRTKSKKEIVKNKSSLVVIRRAR